MDSILEETVSQPTSFLFFVRRIAPVLREEPAQKDLVNYVPVHCVCSDEQTTHPLNQGSNLCDPGFRWHFRESKHEAVEQSVSNASIASLILRRGLSRELRLRNLAFIHSSTNYVFHKMHGVEWQSQSSSLVGWDEWSRDGILPPSQVWKEGLSILLECQTKQREGRRS